MLVTPLGMNLVYGYEDIDDDGMSKFDIEAIIDHGTMLCARDSIDSANGCVFSYDDTEYSMTCERIQMPLREVGSDDVREIVRCVVSSSDKNLFSFDIDADMLDRIALAYRYFEDVLSDSVTDVHKVVDFAPLVTDTGMDRQSLTDVQAQMIHSVIKAFVFNGYQPLISFDSTASDEPGYISLSPMSSMYSNSPLLLCRSVTTSGNGRLSVSTSNEVTFDFQKLYMLRYTLRAMWSVETRTDQTKDSIIDKYAAEMSDDKHGIKLFEALKPSCAASPYDGFTTIRMTHGDSKKEPVDAEEFIATLREGTGTDNASVRFVRNSDADVCGVVPSMCAHGFDERSIVTMRDGDTECMVIMDGDGDDDDRRMERMLRQVMYHGDLILKLSYIS